MRGAPLGGSLSVRQKGGHSWLHGPQRSTEATTLTHISGEQARHVPPCQLRASASFACLRAAAALALTGTDSSERLQDRVLQDGTHSTQRCTLHSDTRAEFGFRSPILIYKACWGEGGHVNLSGPFHILLGL